MTKLTSFVLAVVLAGSVNVFAQGGRFKLGGETPTPAPAPAAASTAPQEGAAPTAAPALTPDQEQKVADIADELAKKAIRVHDANQPHLSKQDVKQLIQSEVPVQSSNAVWNYGLLAGLILLAIIVWFRKPSNGTNTTPPEAGGHAAHCIAFLVFGLTAAALQGATIDHCATDKNEPAFFVNDGSTSKLVCTGKDLAGIKVITFSDAAVTTANVVTTPHLMKFDLTVGKTAKTPNEPDILLDGKTDGHPIGIVDMAKAGDLDFMYRLLKGNGTASSFSSGADPMLRAGLKAEIEIYCAKGCSGKTAAEVYKLAIGTQKGSTAEAFRILETARRKSTVDAVFADDRFVKAASAAPAAGGSSYDPRPIYAELGKVQTAVREVVGVQNDHDKRMENIENLALAEQKQREADQKEAFKTKKLAERTATATLGLRGVSNKSKCGIYQSLQELNPNIEGKVPSGCDPVTPKEKKKKK